MTHLNGLDIPVIEAASPYKNQAFFYQKKFINNFIHNFSNFIYL